MIFSSEFAFGLFGGFAIALLFALWAVRKQEKLVSAWMQRYYDLQCKYEDSLKDTLSWMNKYSEKSNEIKALHEEEEEFLRILAQEHPVELKRRLETETNPWKYSMLEQQIKEDLEDVKQFEEDE